MMRFRWLSCCLLGCHLGDDGHIDVEEPERGQWDTQEDGLPKDTADTEDSGIPDSGGGSDSGDETPEVYEQVEIELAYVGPASLSDFIFWVVAMGAFSSETSCPSRQTIGDGHFRLTGGCTDESGTTFGGTVDIVSGIGGELTYSFTDWTQHNAAGINVVYSMNGSVVTGSEVGVRTNGTFGVIRNSWASTVEYRFTDFVFSSFGEMINAQSASASGGGSYTGTGAVEVVDIGEFTMDYSLTEFGVCESERDELILRMDGELETITYTQSSDSCDGCTDWATPTRSGTICD